MLIYTTASLRYSWQSRMENSWHMTGCKWIPEGCNRIQTKTAKEVYSRHSFGYKKNEDFKH